MAGYFIEMHRDFRMRKSLLATNDVSKIPVFNQMIRAHKEIYNLFGSGIYHKPHSINDVSKIPVVNQMIRAHKEIYTLFGSGIYHKPHLSTSIWVLSI